MKPRRVLFLVSGMIVGHLIARRASFLEISPIKILFTVAIMALMGSCVFVMILPSPTLREHGWKVTLLYVIVLLVACAGFALSVHMLMEMYYAKV